MTGRPPLAPGENGRILLKVVGHRKVLARCLVRDPDGRRRQVTATAATKRQAEQDLKEKLRTRRTPVTSGITASMTIEQLCDFFLERRTKQTVARPVQGRRSSDPRGLNILPQTVGAYAAVIRSTIVPTLGQLRVGELTVGRLDAVLLDLDHNGHSTAQMRTVLNQMLQMARRHEAIAANPMDLVEPLRRERREVEILDEDEVARLRTVVTPSVQKVPGRRGPNRDLADYVDVALGTGARVGEILALRYRDLDLDVEIPTVHICGTLVEPRKGYVQQLHRQPYTKTKQPRLLVLPDHVTELLRSRLELDMRRHGSVRGDDPVFSSRNKTWLWPNNMRTRLRAAVAGTDLAGTTPHTFRRTVGTQVTRSLGLDAAREQLGHIHPGITAFFYVAAAPIGPDVRDVLAPFFAENC